MVPGRQRSLRSVSSLKRHRLGGMKSPLPIQHRKGFTGVLQIDARFMAVACGRFPLRGPSSGFGFSRSMILPKLRTPCATSGPIWGPNSLRQAVDEVGLLGEDMS